MSNILLPQDHTEHGHFMTPVGADIGNGEQSPVTMVSPEASLTEQAEVLLERLPEGVDVQTVRHNLTLMHGQMQELLGGESVGGNGGTVPLDGELYLAAGATGFMDRDSGEIKVFGNDQSVDRQIRDVAARFTMQVILDKLNMQRINDGTFRGFFHIADIQYEGASTEQARRVLEAAQNIYNDLHA